MIPGWLLLLASLLYMAALFAIAWWGDRSKLYPSNRWARPLIYSFALGVYSSSWTFYGAVGTAREAGFLYIAGYIGPLLLMVFGIGFYEKLVRLAKHQNSTSISDLLAARFGRSRRIAVLVTVIALTAIIPYIALQLTAIDMSIDVLTGAVSNASESASPWYRDSTFVVAMTLALFSVLYGTRVIDAAEHHPGMVVAIAAESVFKLLALVAVGVFALTTLDGTAPLIETTSTLASEFSQPSMFLAQVLITLFAFFCLPRQFHVGVVECADVADVRTARWWFGGYLVILSLVVIPIVAATAPLLLDLSNVPQADSLVLLLPMSHGQHWLALLAYLGGFAAATGMVIVASVALSTMISNDLVLPLLWRTRFAAIGGIATSPSFILWVRRIAILGVLLGAYGFFRLTPNAPSLAAIGGLALAAVAQFGPPMLAAVYWPGASRAGVAGGLFTGFVLWLYTLLFPSVLSQDGVSPAWLAKGPFGIDWLAPSNLFGIPLPDFLAQGVFWSLAGNVLVMVALSLRFRPAIVERLRGTGLPPRDELAVVRGARQLPNGATVGDLLVLAERLLGARAARRLLERRSRQLKRHVFADERADFALLHALERDLSGALGASSARLVLTSALRGAGMNLNEIVTLFDEASRRLRFNRELLETMMDNLPQGVCVVNEEMKLVAWNQRYIDLFEYPASLVQAGRPVADLIRYNALRGWCGPGDPEDHVRKRLGYMRSGSAHFSERRRPDGRVIELRGQPLPDRGFVTTFDDVTKHKLTEQSLREVNETLEQRVAERTRQLARASAMAEQANQSKTRFVVAASHDLLQPLGAARLFNAALRGRAVSDPELANLAERVDNSLAAAGELLEGLLDISRLEAGGVRADISEFCIVDLLNSLQEQFAPLAASRGLELRVLPTGMRVRSDQHLLRRILQNFISNALRYTPAGTVLLGCRRRANGLVEVQVIDTGPGIPPENSRTIFEEFQRLDRQSPWGEKGLGLGLSICERISVIVGAELTLRSVTGHGSVFGVRVARAPDLVATLPAMPAPNLAPPLAEQSTARILCVEDDAATLEALRELLNTWGYTVFTASSPEDVEELIRQQRVDVLLADFHLQSRPAGLDLLERLLKSRQPNAPRAGALLTAGATEAVVERAEALGIPVLRKPVKPAALRALVSALVARADQPGSSAGDAS